MLMKTVGDGQAHLDPTRAYRGIALVERFIEMQPEAGRRAERLLAGKCVHQPTKSPLGEDVDEVLFNALLDTCCRLKDSGTKWTVTGSSIIIKQ